MSRTAKAAVLILLLAGTGGAAMLLLRPNSEPIETVALKQPAQESPAMCPWRDPKRDIQAFFPGASGYRTEIISLSAIRPQILKRLGPGARIESHSLYIYRVLRGDHIAGTILVQRASGPHGAIEIVIGVGPDRRLSGVSLQRERERPDVMKSLKATWFPSFRGKEVDDLADMPHAPIAARPVAEAIASSVRTLMVEFDAGENQTVRPQIHMH